MVSAPTSYHLSGRLYSRIFIVAGFLLFGAGLMYKLISKVKNRFYKAAVHLTLFTALFLICSNLAVGVIGDESNPANLMYIGVLAAIILGAIIARCDSRGLAHTLYVTAATQVLLTGAALITTQENSIMLITINTFFVLLWLSAALLFQKSSKKVFA